MKHSTQNPSLFYQSFFLFLTATALHPRLSRSCIRLQMSEVGWSWSWSSKTPLYPTRQVTIHHHQVLVFCRGECIQTVPSRSIFARTVYHHLTAYLRPPKFLIRACSSLVHWRIFVAISALSPPKPSVSRDPMGSSGNARPDGLPSQQTLIPDLLVQKGIKPRQF
jgi:hypothetical protein